MSSKIYKHQPQASVASLQSVASLESDCSEPAEQQPSISPAPPPSRASNFPGRVPPQCPPDSSPHSFKLSPVVPRPSSLATPETTSSQIQRPSTWPVSEPNPGLNALFQQPVRLKKTYSAPSTSGSSSDTRSSQHSLFTVSSITSLRSTISEQSVYSEASRPDSSTSQRSARPTLALSSSNTGVGVKVEQILRGKMSTAAEPRDQRIALSHLSAYHARISDESSRAIESVLHGVGDDDSSSIEDTTSAICQLKETTGPQLTSSTTIDLDSLESSGGVGATQSPDSGLMVMTPEIENRRCVADSLAWQRRTRMLQIDYPRELDRGREQSRT